MDKKEILRQFEVFSTGNLGGITNWLTESTDDAVFRRLEEISSVPLTRSQLNQLLVLAHEAPVSDGFYRYYWLTAPDDHPYNVRKLPHYSNGLESFNSISSLPHLLWGFYRLFVDGMLWFGNVRTAYRSLRERDITALKSFFDEKCHLTQSMSERGGALPLRTITKDDRYLISEMACKSYGDTAESVSELKNALVSAFEGLEEPHNRGVTIKSLLEGEIVKKKFGGRQSEFIFSADDVLNETVSSQEDINSKYGRVAQKFVQARDSALANTRLYLSMVGDLDVYVATSMRTREDFRHMATTCETIFTNEKLQNLNLRHFDPTLSAASGHEDKGLIECLMVKCAKVLVYCAGERESWGKDAEAAMALSQGKPVIFYCDKEQRSRFYRDVHPLSRLIDFNTGVAVGAIVTDQLDDVITLLDRIFNNQMEYALDKRPDGYLRLKESLTSSVVRLQTSDQLLNETFWNHYHGKTRPSI